MHESMIERRLVLRCKREGFLCLKFVSPNFSGVPDRMVFVKGGGVVFVELKAPKQVERSRQTYVQDLLRHYGFTVFSSVDSFEKVEEVIDWCKRLQENL